MTKVCSAASGSSLGHSVALPRLGVNSVMKSAKAWAFIARTELEN